jgi:hypothetical protein
VDVNDDGKVNLLVANDSTPNYLYLNKGDGTFKDASFSSIQTTSPRDARRELGKSYYREGKAIRA